MCSQLLLLVCSSAISVKCVYMLVVNQEVGLRGSTVPATAV